MISGLDMSPEEMRLKAVEAQARGDMNSYVSHPFLCSEN
jgi:hypothetical protein